MTNLPTIEHLTGPERALSGDYTHRVTIRKEIGGGVESKSTYHKTLAEAEAKQSELLTAEFHIHNFTDRQCQCGASLIDELQKVVAETK